ncbi:hypothetical protein CV102_11065 [Natronococcus pandeyae]|uniref:DUF1102 domain-containing protein n=1 Tax=Natronococcus pandeyae TaxID=2055836 RepID=A0A8J8TQD6_9EURY|nr:hypothetical protein [Natronococcus pandeyae]TYL38348.1 hypothetical protein CV102_11065 [Natronococcus pandeyae]
MKLNRRNVLVGLGTIVAGGGAALGTGAFSSVEADRSVTIETDGDDSALLQIVPNEGYNGDAGDYVDDSDDSIEIVIGDDDNSDTGDTGVNVNATTTFIDLLEVTNNGSQDVGFYVESKEDLGEDELLNFKAENQDTIIENSNAVDLSSENGSTTISLEINADEDTDVNDFPDEVTFFADEDVYNT